MFWSLSFQLLPDETIIDDSSRRRQTGIKPAYSVFLTNRRVIFRFDGLGSSMAQSFFYSEILDVRPTKRLFFPYLLVRTQTKEYLLNTADADYWAGRILEMKKETPADEKAGRPRQDQLRRGKRELLDMLMVLRKHSILTDAELDEKVQLLDSMKP